MSRLSRRFLPRLEGMETRNTPSHCLLSFTKASYTVTEGTAEVTISVQRTEFDHPNVSVRVFSTDGTGKASADYRGVNTTLQWADGEMGIKTFKVRITNDTLNEATETVKLTLADATNGASTSLPFQATLRILDNDPALPAVRISNAVVTEGNGGFVNATFTVTLSKASGQTVSMKYVTSPNTAKSISDYLAISPTTLKFAAGVTTKTITVKVKGDTLKELHESFFVRLTDVKNATIADGSGVGIIRNDDA